MPDPVTPAAPAAPTTAAPAATPAAVSDSPAVASPPAAALATPDKPAAASAEPAKPAEPPTRPESLIPDPDKPAADPAKPGEPAAGAPEKYEAWKLPEGVTLPAEATQQFETFAREEGLSQDRAQKYLDRHVAELKKGQEAIYNNWYDTQRTWQAEITADKNVGGDKLPASKQAIGRVLNHLGPELGKQFREALDFTGAGNNPAVFRGLVKLAERFSEGTSVNGSPTTQAKSAASVLYPTHSKG